MGNESRAVEGQRLNDLLLDGMHPNDQRHRMIADALLPIIVAQAKHR